MGNYGAQAEAGDCSLEHAAAEACHGSHRWFPISLRPDGRPLRFPSEKEQGHVYEDQEADYCQKGCDIPWFENSRGGQESLREHREPYLHIRVK